MARSTVETVFDAPRDRVYQLFSERDSISPHLPINVTLVRPGATARDGVGAQYLLGVGKLGVTEETTELEPGRRMEYKIVKGAPVKQHIGSITFADTSEGGTRVVYTMESEPSLPAPAKAVEFALRQLINQFLSGARKALR